MSEREYEFHEAAAIFPLMVDSDYDDLVADIRKVGLRETIKLFEGKVIDGRNRYRACLETGVKRRYEEIETDDPVAYVISLNLCRRHLNESQRAMCAARAREWYDKAAKERQRLSEGRGVKGPVNLPDLKGDARDQAGEAFGVSGTSVDFASRVLKKAIPELQEAVESGKVAVSTAARSIAQGEDEQRRVVERGKNGKPKRRPNDQVPHVADGADERKVRGVGVARGYEAINCLKRIPENDPLRNRGFQIVVEWIRHNK